MLMTNIYKYNVKKKEFERAVKTAISVHFYRCKISFFSQSFL